MRLIFIFFVLFGHSAFAVEKDPHHNGILSSINLGFRYSSLLENRGVISYRDFQIDPILALFFLDDRVEFLGDSIGFRDFIWSDQLRLRSRFVSVTDQPLFPADDSLKAAFAHRSDTYEWNNRAEFFIPGYNDDYQAEIDVSYSKDLKVHFGNYFEIQSKFKLFSFREPIANVTVEPNLFGSIGWGDKGHNEYFYGQNAKQDGFNNFSYGIWFAFPEEADRYYPIVQIIHFETIGDFRSGSLASGRDNGWLFSFIATYGVLD